MKNAELSQCCNHAVKRQKTPQKRHSLKLAGDSKMLGAIASSIR